MNTYLSDELLLGEEKEPLRLLMDIASLDIYRPREVRNFSNTIIIFTCSPLIV